MCHIELVTQRVVIMPLPFFHNLRKDRVYTETLSLTGHTLVVRFCHEAYIFIYCPRCNGDLLLTYSSTSYKL